jgi:DHA2 family multidrug resistance protein
VGYLLGKGWDARLMLVFGFVVSSMAFFGYSHMSLESGTWDILLHQINQGSGMAFVFIPLTIITMESIPKAETGYATSLYSVMRNIGSSIGISFVTTWVARRSQFHQSILAAHVTPYDLRSQEFLGQVRGFLFHQGFDWSTAGHGGLGVLYGMLQQQAALISFVEVFRIMGFLFLATIPLVLLMRRASRRGTAPAAE